MDEMVVGLTEERVEGLIVEITVERVVGLIVELMVELSSYSMQATPSSVSSRALGASTFPFLQYMVCKE